MAENVALPPMPTLVNNLHAEQCNDNQEDYDYKGMQCSEGGWLCGKFPADICGIGAGDIDGGDDLDDLESEFTSISVRGMVTIQRQRSETARLAMNTFLAVTIAINSTYR